MLDTCVVDLGTIKTFNNKTYHYAYPGKCRYTLASDCSGNNRFSISEKIGLSLKEIQMDFAGHTVKLEPGFNCIVDKETVVVTTSRYYRDPTGLFTIKMGRDGALTYLQVDVKNHFTVIYYEERVS